MAMQSLFAQLLLAIQTKVATGLPAIRYTDQDLGQLKAERPPVAWPCLLVDMETFHCTNLANNVQNCEGTIVFRLGFAPYSPTATGTETWAAEKALQYYELEWQLHRLLQGWHPTTQTGALCRLSTQTQRRNDTLRVREMRYSLSFEDYSTQNILRWVPATVLLTDELDE